MGRAVLLGLAIVTLVFAWQSVHGRGSTPPPPGPGASGRDEAEQDGD